MCVCLSTKRSIRMNEVRSSVRLFNRSRVGPEILHERLELVGNLIISIHNISDLPTTVAFTNRGRIRMYSTHATFYILPYILHSTFYMTPLAPWPPPPTPLLGPQQLYIMGVDAQTRLNHMYKLPLSTLFTLSTLQRCKDIPDHSTLWPP